MVERWTRDAQGFVTWPDGEWVRYSDYAALEAKLAEARKALEPFALVAEHDIGEDESDTDLFRPLMLFNRVPRIRVGHLRAARRALEGGE